MNVLCLKNKPFSNDIKCFYNGQGLYGAYLGNFVQCILHNDGEHSILHCLTDLSLVLTYKVNADWVSHWLGNVLGRDPARVINRAQY